MSVQTELRAAPKPPLSPLFISDRLIALAEQAGEAGCAVTARRLLRLASTVLDEPAARSLARVLEPPAGKPRELRRPARRLRGPA